MDALPLSRADDIVRLLVCSTCREAGVSADDPQRPGARLGAAIAERLKADPQSGVAVELVECLSVCKRPCTVALSGAGRWTYVYADVDPESGADLLIGFARQYRATEDGIVPWRERPEPIRKGVVARLPPQSKALP